MEQLRFFFSKIILFKDCILFFVTWHFITLLISFLKIKQLKFQVAITINFIMLYKIVP